MTTAEAVDRAKGLFEDGQVGEWHEVAQTKTTFRAVAIGFAVLAPDEFEEVAADLLEERDRIVAEWEDYRRIWMETRRRMGAR